MKLKDKFCNFLNGLVDSRLNNTKKVTTSYVALFLVLSIFAVSTFSWFTIRDTATIDSLFICAAREVVCALKRAVINNSEVAA